MTKLEKEYNREYGNIPNDVEGQILYIKNNFKVNTEKLADEIKRITNIKWNAVYFSLPIIPFPSQRPRLGGGGHFYVKGAKDHHSAIKSIINERHIIFTLVKLDVRIYQPIPCKSMSGNEIMLAQLGLIRPISGGDWDNFAKTYCDAIQKHVIINDNIIVKGSCEKFYSIKPRVELDLFYQDEFDSNFNRKKITHSKLYQEYEKEGNLYAINQ